MSQTSKLPELSERDLTRIYQIGLKRLPNEACGLILYLPGGDRQTRVVELPNRSHRPSDSYVMSSEDIRLSIQGTLATDAVAWHTHPRGLIGPSQADMKTRPTYEVPMLVVSITKDGPIPSWF